MPAWSENALKGSVLVAWAIGLGFAFSLDDPRLRFPSFVASFACANLAWLGLLAWRPQGRAWIVAGLLVGALARWLGLLQAPAFSEDVFRYLFEGRVMWFTDPTFPLRVPPADAPHHGISPAVLDASWLRINHPELPTIYPPLSQALFGLCGGLSLLLGTSGLLLLKGALVLVEGVTVAGLARRPALRSSLVWGWWLCPLAIWETSREGHIDLVSACALALGVATCGIPRVGRAHAWFAIAALAKLNGIPALVASVRHAPRALGPAAGLLALLVVPLSVAGASADSGLGAYATRWRAGDLAFSGILWAAEGLLEGDYTRWGSWTVTRHQAARALTLVIWTTLALIRLRGRPSVQRIPRDAGFLVVTLLLLSPTFHPWYALWLLPFSVLPGASDRPWTLRWLLASAALLHVPGWMELQTGVWAESWLVRGIVHVPAWILLVWEGRSENQQGVGHPIASQR